MSYTPALLPLLLKGIRMCEETAEGDNTQKKGWSPGAEEQPFRVDGCCALSLPAGRRMSALDLDECQQVAEIGRASCRERV